MYFDSIDNVAWVSRRSNVVYKRNEIGGACSKHGRGDVYRFWWLNLKERDYLEDLGIDGSIILK